MLNYLRKPLHPVINFVAKPFKWIHPDILSFGTLIISIPGFYFLAIGDSLLGSLFVIGALFDVVDGAVARMTGKTSRFGGVLDATIDRIYEGLAMLAIGIGDLVPWEALFAYYVTSVCVSYIKAKAEAVTGTKNVGMNEFAVGLIERGERLSLLFIACVANGIFTKNGNEILQLTIIFLAIGSFITLIWRGISIRKVLS